MRILKITIMGGKSLARKCYFCLAPGYPGQKVILILLACGTLFFVANQDECSSDFEEHYCPFCG